MRMPLFPLIAPLISLAGCAKASSLPVSGAYFPDWLFCVLAGVFLTCVIRAVLLSKQHGEVMGPPALAYPALILLLSLLCWLIVFN
jgi:hypothetical protein